MRGGLTENHLVAVLLGSNEFNQGLTDQAFVQKLYEIVLDRVLDAEGNEDHMIGLNHGVTRQALAESFLQSREYAENVVDQEFESLLGRNASISGQAEWVQYLEKPSVEASVVVEKVLGSSEGVNRLRTMNLLGTPNPSNDQVPISLLIEVFPYEKEPNPWDKYRIPGGELPPRDNDDSIRIRPYPNHPFVPG